MIKLRNINKYYIDGKIKTHILKNVNLDINNGEFVSIMGPSGSGKSTLLNIIGCFDYKFDGSYTFNNLKINKENYYKFRKRYMGFVFQDFKLISNISVQDNIGLPLIYRGYKKDQIHKNISRQLKLVKLDNLAKKFPTELSGGQKQRISIARALVSKPKLIIADEPTGSLDTDNSEMIMNLLKEINSNGTTVVIVTHDNYVAKKGNRILHLVDGKLNEDYGI